MKYDWQVHIFYRVTCYYTEEIIGLLKSIDCPKDKAREATIIWCHANLIPVSRTPITSYGNL